VSNTKDLRELKIRTDSLEQEVRYKDQYLESIRSVLQGKYDSEDGHDDVEDTEA